MVSRPTPLPQIDLSPIRVPVVPKPFFQSISRMPVVPTARPSTSITQMTESGSRADPVEPLLLHIDRRRIAKLEIARRLEILEPGRHHRRVFRLGRPEPD